VPLVPLDSFSERSKTTQQIEYLIQQQYQIFVPALVLDFSNNDKDWDKDDLFKVCSYFGDIDCLEIIGKSAILLFRHFIDAFSCKEYLLNTNNFKSLENGSSNIVIRWYSPEDEKQISKSLQNKIKATTPDAVINSVNHQSYLNPNCLNYNNPDNFSTNINTLNAYYAAWTLTPSARNEFGNLVTQQMNYFSQVHNQRENINYNNNNNNSSNNNNMNNINNNNNNNNINNNNNTSYNSNVGSYYNNFASKQNAFSKSIYTDFPNEPCEDEQPPFKSPDKIFNGKYTCRFEIQIENDKDFQVSRRLIGAKGCNMKRIIEKCNQISDGRTFEEPIKLRLRGRGSGFKEGPKNQESDEPLHLCISSKYYEKYRNACSLVQELIINIYEEYKRYCERNTKTPISALNIKKYEGIYSRRDTYNSNDGQNCNFDENN